MDSDLFLFDRFIHQRVPARLIGRYFPRDLLGFCSRTNLAARAIYIYQIACFPCYLSLG